MKRFAESLQCLNVCRPFTGAWIETYRSHAAPVPELGRPFTGAWIETPMD